MVLRAPDETTMIWAGTAQAIMITIGYLAACVAAGLFSAAAATKLGGVYYADPLAEFGHFTFLASAASVTAMLAGFWPSAAVVALTEGLKLRGIATYLVAGCVIGLIVALPISEFLRGADVPELQSPMIQLSVASGAIGGFVYWLIAGRTAGRWLSYRLFEENRR